MKIIKNRTIQIISAIALVVGAIVTFTYLTKPVMASDELTKGEYNLKMEEIEKQFTELKERIDLLEDENKELKANIINLTDELNKETNKTNNLEKNIKANQTQITKLNKWYDFNKDLYAIKESAYGQSYSSSTEYIKSELVKYFKQN
jgi:chromosome segregation ATPase